MDAPSFIFDLFEKELKNIQSELLCKVATKYGLDEDELITTFLEDNKLKLIPNNNITVVITKKKHKDKDQDDEGRCRCRARVWNRGKGGQCTRYVQEGNYCAQHTAHRKHGTIDDKADPKIFPKNPTAIYI
jgi:hypothetical protein